MRRRSFRSAPVTQQAVVTVNALFDRFFCNHRKTLNGDATTLEYQAGDDSNYTIAQRDLVFRLKPSANALIGRGDSGGIMDMKVRPMPRVCLCSSSRVFIPNAAEGFLQLEQLPHASSLWDEECQDRPARTHGRFARVRRLRRRRLAARRLHQQEF
jgi:hypothetical protein